MKHTGEELLEVKENFFVKVKNIRSVTLSNNKYLNFEHIKIIKIFVENPVNYSGHEYFDIEETNPLFTSISKYLIESSLFSDIKYRLMSGEKLMLHKIESREK